jgi:hypothetical protein
VDTKRMTQSELDRELQRWNPVDRAALDDESVLAALASLQRTFEPEAERWASPLPRRRDRLQGRWWLTRIGAATTAVVVASLVGVEVLSGGGAGAGLPLAVSAAAAAQLDKVAHAAAAQAAPGVGQWEYSEVKIENNLDSPIGSTSIRWSYAYTVQEWDGPEPGGDRRQRMTAHGVTFATPKDAASYAANKSAFDSKYLSPPTYPTGDPTGTGVISDHLVPHAWEQQQPASVWGTSSPPTDPQTLLGDLGHIRGTLSSERLEDKWGGLMNILRSSTNPQLRATAYQALKYVPDTTVLGTETDQIGRTGVAFEFTGYPGDRDTIIASPTTGDLLENTVALASASRGMPAGTVVQTEIDLQRGVVNSGTALPGGSSQPLQSTPEATTTTGSSPATGTTSLTDTITTASTSTTTIAGTGGTTTASTAQTTTSGSQTS